MSSGKALPRPRMDDARWRKPPFGQAVHPVPSEVVPLTAAKQTPSPQPGHSFPKHVQGIGVSRYRMVVEVALHDRLEPLPRLRHRIMPACAEDLLEFLQLLPHALADRLAP